MIKRLLVLGALMCVSQNVMAMGTRSHSAPNLRRVALKQAPIQTLPNNIPSTEPIAYTWGQRAAAAVLAGASGLVAQKVADKVAATTQQVADANKGSRTGYYAQKFGGILAGLSWMAINYGVHKAAETVTGTEVPGITFCAFAVGSSAIENGYAPYRDAHESMTKEQIAAALHAQDRRQSTKITP